MAGHTKRRSLEASGETSGAETTPEAKVFMTGRSQAVRLPKQYRVSGDSVYVKRLGNAILLVPKTGDRWAGLFSALDEFPRDFRLPRDQRQRRGLGQLFGAAGE
jgi:antitoxin VapB